MASLTQRASLSKLGEIVKDREAWRPAVHGVSKSGTRVSDRRTVTTINGSEKSFYEFNSKAFMIFIPNYALKMARWILTLFDPMACSLPGSFIHGILQARMLEWVAISFSRGSS